MKVIHFSHNKKNSLKIIEEAEKIKLSHIRNGNYNKKYINLAWMELWKDYVNFFTNNGRIKYSERFHKYVTLSKKHKLELKLKILTKYLIFSNRLCIKYFFIIDVHIIFLSFFKIDKYEEKNAWYFSSYPILQLKNSRNCIKKISNV